MNHIIIGLFLLLSCNLFAQKSVEQQTAELLINDSIVDCSLYYLGKWTHKEGPSCFDLINVLPDSVSKQICSDPFKHISDAKKNKRLVINSCFEKHEQKQKINISNGRTLGSRIYVKADYHSIDNNQIDLYRLIVIYSLDLQLIRYELEGLKISD